MNKIEGYPLTVSEPATMASCASKSISTYILDAITANGLSFEDHDILIVASKLVSIFEDRTIEMRRITPSIRARLVGMVFGKDPIKVELILSEGQVQAVVPLRWIGQIPSMWAKLAAFAHDSYALERLYKSYSVAFMMKTQGVLLDDGGIDLSNAPEGWASLLPVDANASAQRIRAALREQTQKDIAIIITDTAAVPGKMGGQDIAIGCAGLDPVGRHYAAPDVFGNPKMGGLELVADPLAGVGGLLMGQTNESIPLCVIRGFSYAAEAEEGGLRSSHIPVAYSRGVLFILLWLQLLIISFLW